MAKHRGLDLRIDDTAQDRYEKANAETEYIDGEYENRHSGGPCSVIRQIVEEC